ncbi:MAG: cytochrome c biogenesis protein CcsA [Gammaproteobacteria bacterium]|jgi:ABC-type uncharacterized transport system permease subunit
MHQLLPLVTSIFYLITALLAAIRLFRPATGERIGRNPVLVSGFIAVILHAVELYFNLHTDRGINLAFFQALSLAGWTIAIVTLVSAFTKPVENLAIFMFPFIAAAVLLAAVSDSSMLLRAGASWQLGLHVLTSLLAWSMFAIASVQSLLLWIQDRHLHNRQPGGFIRALPPLQTMESLLFEFIGIGLLLLTGSLVSGFLFLEDMFAQHLVHKTVLSLLAWVIFAILMWGRYRFGWRGKKALHWTIGGFIVLLLAYFGSKAVLELILQQSA